MGLIVINKMNSVISSNKQLNRELMSQIVELTVVAWLAKQDTASARQNAHAC